MSQLRWPRYRSPVHHLREVDKEVFLWYKAQRKTQEPLKGLRWSVCWQAWKHPGSPWLSCGKSPGRGHSYSDCDPHDSAPDKQSRLTDWSTYKLTLWRNTVSISVDATVNIVCFLNKFKNMVGLDHCFLEILKRVPSAGPKTLNASSKVVQVSPWLWWFLSTLLKFKQSVLFMLLQLAVPPASSPFIWLSVMCLT